MGSSFEDIVATSPTVKTDAKLDIRFELQNFLNFPILAFNADDVSSFFYCQASLLAYIRVGGQTVRDVSNVLS